MLKEYQKVKEIAIPFLTGQKEYKFLLILGQTSQAIGNLESAISYYKEYLTRFGTNLQILNTIGECYNRLGKMAEALEAWEKSLEIDPDQEEIQRKVKNLKEKK
jgi:tetratricopeptide (TPR) repeat protein